MSANDRLREAASALRMMIEDSGDRAVIGLRLSRESWAALAEFLEDSACDTRNLQLARPFCREVRDVLGGEVT